MKQHGTLLVCHLLLFCCCCCLLPLALASSSSETFNFLRHRQEKCGLHVPSYIVPQHLMIAHRGASFHLPEHTLAAYRLALELGADYIEPDLVVTKDGHLVAVHDMDLNLTTNVAQVFNDTSNNASNNSNRLSYSKLFNRTSYWVYDFTLAELQTLRVKQRLPQYRSTAFDESILGIPTLEQIFALIDDWNTNLAPHFSLNMSYWNTVMPIPPTFKKSFNGKSNNNNNGGSGSSSSSSSSSSSTTNVGIKRRRAGVYAELKHAAWLLEEKGMDMVQLFLNTLEAIYPPPKNDANTTTNSTNTTGNRRDEAVILNQTQNHNPNMETNATETSNTTLTSTAVPSNTTESNFTTNSSIPLPPPPTTPPTSSLAALWHDAECLSLKYDEYIIPLLVVQSFEGNVLSQLYHEWKRRYDNTTSFLPPPPMVLLLDQPDCIREDIWFQIGDNWRSVIQGIGPHKDCLLPTTTTALSNNSTLSDDETDNVNNNNHHPTNNNHQNSNLPWETLVDLALKHELVLHPWTERPEEEFLSDATTSNSTVWDELKTLFCHRSPVHGIFTEHLHMTIMATWWFSSGGCGDAPTSSSSTSTTTNGGNNNNNGFRNHNPNNYNGTASNKMCFENNGSANLTLGVVSFLMGSLVSVMATLWYVSRQQQQQQGDQFIFRPRGSSRRGMRVPNHDLELEMI